MNLEAIEQRCFTYLKQVANPLVSVNVLLCHVRADPACATITEKELLDFLREHELFKVLEPVGLALEERKAGAFEDAGLNTGPRVILSTRVPTSDQLARLMADELVTLASALTAALKEARDQGQTDRVEKCKRLLARLRKLSKKLEGVP